MEQSHVFLDLDSYNSFRLIQQNSDEQIQQQQQQQFHSQGIIMSGNEQSQDVDQTHQVIYSPIKPSEPQYVAQDEAMQSPFLIQTPSGSQQIFYTNISPQNQNRLQQQQQTVTLNHNLIAQQNPNQPKLVLQNPKVVVQRNPDLLQSATNMAQIVDHNQQIQYHFTPNMDQNQTYQILQPQPSQQIKQTIYPQQSNQVVQPHYLQLQQSNVVPQGAKVLMQGGNQLQYRFIPKPQQQTQQIAVQNPGQMLQINQQAQQIQTQPPARQFRSRLITPARFQVRVGSPQQQQIVSMAQQKVRTPRPRPVRPTAQTPVVHQVQNNQQQRSPLQKVYYILQTQPDGSQVLVPHQHNQQNQSTQNIVRLVQQKVGQTNQQPQSQQQQQQHQLFQVPPSQLNNSNQEQQQLPLQNQSQSAVEIHTPPTTSTFTPKKDGDCDDLEESITATAISKSTCSEPPPLQPQTNTVDDYRKNLGQQTSSRVGVVKPMMNSSGNQMRSPNRNPALQVIRQRPIPRQQFQQHGVQLELEAPERESAKMLVILDNGEQRLITFTLPKETCTVQELLDQVGIKVGADSNIECIENPGSEIDYIVKVGNFASRDTAAMTKAAENHIRQQQQRQQSNQNNRNTILPQSLQVLQQTTEIANSKSPELKVPPPKYVTGYYAVCAACGFSGVDHAKCVRCNRIFTEEPKTQRIPPNQQQQKHVNLQSIASSTQTQKVIHTMGPARNLDKKDQIEALQKKHQMATAVQRQTQGRSRGGLTASASRRGPRSKAKPVEQEVVTLSSDDENGSDESKSSAAKSLAEKKEEIFPKKHFEPEIVDDVESVDFTRKNVDQFDDSEQRIATSITCRTVRIGSYKFDSKEKVMITAKGIKIVAPSLKNVKDLIVLNIQDSEIVKVVTHFTKQLHIIFLYTKPSCARYIAEQLQMTQVDEKSPYFSPLSRHEPHKKIVFLADTVSDETKSVIKTIFNRQILEEITNRDANEMLVRSTGIPLSNSNAPLAASILNSTGEGSVLQDVDVKKLLIYPPGRGGIAINTNDYICLGSDVYLNDVIIDFYLKYVHLELLTKDQQDKTHIFSQFFYKRLTTMTKEKDPKLSAAQKRHARVASWTKSVNLFEKDFIIIPINEQSHWFLVIICFANLMEPHTMDTNQPIKLIPAQKRAKKKTSSVQIGSTTITPLTKKEEAIHITDEDASERDEAEGDESDMGSNLESEDEEVVDRGQPVKVPCVLIFDSLLGAPRSRVVATLRDYLTCEYKAKYPNSPPRLYTKMNLPGNQVKVPQQNNFTDCGLFLLQYVEQFFKDPIKDYRIPIKTQQNWFHQDLVTRKREEIAKLIQELIKRDTPEGIELPEIDFPTKDGVILEPPDETKVDNAFDDDEYVPTEEDMRELSQNGSKSSQEKEQTKRVFFSKKRSLDKSDSSSGESQSKTPKLNARNKS